jgi:DNA-binding response OmpR family regulator
LVFDDDPQILRTLRINLTARGYAVRTAADGASAPRVAADRRPDVMVLDLGLPDLDGNEVIAGLRGWTTVPIIVLSARTDPSTKCTPSTPAPTTTSPNPAASPSSSPD